MDKQFQQPIILRVSFPSWVSTVDFKRLSAFWALIGHFIDVPLHASKCASSLHHKRAKRAVRAHWRTSAYPQKLCVTPDNMNWPSSP
jgi:hypothetical protein